MLMAANLLLQKISSHRTDLTPKARLIGDYILNNPRKVIFMTTKELSRAARVSEATVIRFVNQLGYKGYGDFLQELRDIIDTELTLIDRVGLTDMKAPESERFRRVVFSEIDNLKQLHESLDLDKVNRAVELLHASSAVYVVGSRLSYTFAYYLGWSLTKIRTKVHIMRGSDSTCIDFLTIAPEESLVVIFATTRYPNELIRLGQARQTAQADAARDHRRCAVPADPVRGPVDRRALAPHPVDRQPDDPRLPDQLLRRGAGRTLRAGPESRTRRSWKRSIWKTMLSTCLTLQVADEDRLARRKGLSRSSRSAASWRPSPTPTVQKEAT